MWSRIAIVGALTVMGGALYASVVDNFAYVDTTLDVAMPLIYEPQAGTSSNGTSSSTASVPRRTTKASRQSTL